jgi:hypothetical protein
MRGGRARWKIENETFNTLKNQGYNLGHNYGLGKKNLAIQVLFGSFGFHIPSQLTERLYGKGKLSLKNETSGIAALWLVYFL